MKPYYEDDAVTIYHGDAREILPALTFDVVVTDPPYGIGYEQTMKSAPKWESVNGDESDVLARWVIEAVHPTPMLVFGANHFPSALPEPGRWVCWDKRVVEAADRMLGSPFELAWMNGPDKAGFMYRIQHAGVVNADRGANNANNMKRRHPTQKPVTLMKRIIADHFPTGVIADPFMGAGSTLRAAKDLGRRAVGIEIEERYCEAAVARLAQEVLAL